MSEQISIVRKRHVFYLPGFDPRGARHYHQIYKAEAEKQSAVTGQAYHVSSRRKQADDIYRWHVRSGDTETTYDFLGWDDIVRAEWPQGVSGIVSDIAYFCRHYILTGHVWRFGRDKPARVLTGFFPLFVLLSSLLLSSGVAYAMIKLWPTLWGLALAIISSITIFHGCMRWGRRIAVFWLSRIFAFSLQWARGDIPALTPRLATFRDAIADVLAAGDVDEVLVVGHSVGGMIAVPVLANILQDAPTDIKISFLTVGACIPMASYWPGAQTYRNYLSAVAHDPRVTWVDYAAKSDGASYHMVDPVTTSGMTRSDNAGPLLKSPRFFTLYHPATYKKMRHDWYRTHFLYLMAGEKSGGYDFFRMTAGPFYLREAAL